MKNSRYSTDFGDEDLEDAPVDPVELMRTHLARGESPPMFVCFQVLTVLEALRKNEKTSQR